MRLNVKAFALAGGILWGSSMFVLTWLSILGYGSVEAAAVAKSYYVGYTVSPVGSLLGAVYGFLDAGIGTAIFALLYNRLTNK